MVTTRRDETTAKFVSDSVLTYGTELANAALLFVNGVIVARALGPGGRGIYAVMVLVPLTLFSLGNLGFFQGLVHGSVKEPGSLGRRTVNATLLAGTAGLVATAVAFGVFGSGVIEEFDKAPAIALPLALAGIPAIYFNHFARALVLGQDDLAKRNLLRLVEPASYFLGALLFVVLLERDIAGAMVAWVASHWVVSALGAWYLFPGALAAGFRPDVASFKADLRFGAESYAGSVAGFLLHRQDQFLVAYFREPQEVGHYAVAYSLIMMMGILPNAIQAAFLPKVTARYYEDGRQESMTPFVCRVMILFSGLLALAAAALVWPVIRLFYGAAFLPAVPPFLLLLPAVTFLAGLSTIHSAMQARSAQRWISIGAVVALVINLGLDLWMIPRWGIEGAAIASGVAYLVMLAIVVKAFLAIDRHLGWGDLLIPRRDDLREVAGRLRELAGRVRQRRGRT